MIQRTKRKRNLLSIKNLIILLIALFLFLIFLFFKSPLLPVKEIEVVLESVDCVSLGEVENELSIRGQSFFSINDLYFERKIKQKYSCVKTVKIEKIFPDKIILMVLGRQPVAVVFILNKGSSTADFSSSSAEIISGYLIDDEGIDFKQSLEDKGLLKIYVDEKSPDDLKKAVFIVNKLKNFSLEIKQVKILDGQLIIDSKFKIFFVPDTNIDQKLAALQLILEQAKIDGKELESIDLRFDKPVIKYASKKIKI